MGRFFQVPNWPQSPGALSPEARGSAIADWSNNVLVWMQSLTQILDQTLQGEVGSGALGAHRAQHQAGGSDEINVTALSGVLTDPQTPKAHNLLSAYHGDSTAASVVRGDIIIGSGATPKWTRLAVGAATTYLKGGTEPSWATLNQAAVAGLTTADSPTFVGLTLSGLTAKSVLFAGAGGVVSQDNTQFYYDDPTDTLYVANLSLLAGGLITVPGLTPGQVVFPGTGGVLSGDASLFWDNTNKQLLLGVGSAALPARSYIGRTTDGEFSPAAGALGWAIAEAEKMRLTATGLGINITVPVGTLDVGGFTYARGAVGVGTEGEQIRFGRSDSVVRPHSIYSSHSSAGASNWLEFRIHDMGGTPYQGQTPVLRMTTVALDPRADNARTLGIADQGWQALHLADAAHSPAAEGEVRASSVFRDLMAFNAGIAGRIPTVLLAQTTIAAGDTCGNKSTVQTLASSELTLPANFWAAASVNPKHIEIRAAGEFTTKVAPQGTFNVRVMYGATVLLNTNLGESASVAIGKWELNAIIRGATAGAGGSVEVCGTLRTYNDVRGTTVVNTMFLNAAGAATIDGTVAVDTTAAADLEITWQWSTAAANNTTTMTECRYIGYA